MLAVFRFTLFATLVAAAAAIPASAQTPDGLEAAVDRLTVTVEQLATRLPGANCDDGGSGIEKVQAAIGILGLRYRKLERIEGEIRDISRREEELPSSISIMRQELERMEAEIRAETDQLSEATREELGIWETQIEMEEDRLARLRERKVLLENDLTTEQRRLIRVEAILDEWLEGLE